EYRELVTVYNAESKEFEALEQACRELCAKIQETVDSRLLPLTFQKENAYKMLLALRDNLKPNDSTTNMQLTLEWRQLTRMIQKGDNIDNWLLNLESTFN